MAVYNAAPYLSEAVRSVLGQDYPSFELILCDDGSKDSSYKIASRFAAQDSRIKVLRNSGNKGPAAARNKILLHARGEYFAPHDADDLMLAGRLSESCRILKNHPEVGVVFGHELALRPRRNGKLKMVAVRACTMTSAGIRSIGERGKLKTFPFIPHGASMIRTSIARMAGGYPEDFRIGEDRLLFRKLWTRTQFYCLDRFVYIHRFHGNNLTSACRDRFGIFKPSKFVRSLPTPRITVAIPVYNGARYLSHSLESVLQQDYSNFEVVVYDDGSSDNSRKIAERFRIMDPRVRVYGSGVNLGVAHARNRILRLARGEYIALHDADDIMLADRLKSQVKILDENARVGLVFGHNFVIRGGRRTIEKTMKAWAYCGKNQGRFLRRSGLVKADCRFPTGSVMFRKEAASGGYDERLKLGSDQEIFRRMRGKTGFYFLDKFAYVYRLHRHSLTATRERATALEARRQFRQHQANFKRAAHQLVFRWHGGLVKILSERKHFLSILRKNLSYYMENPPGQKGPFKKIRIEVRYRTGRELGIRYELNDEMIARLELYKKAYFFTSSGVLKIFIHKDHRQPDSGIYHSCFLIPMHKIIRKFNAMLVHGALLGEKKSGVLILGHDGAGKSTLSALLVSAGLPYFSEEHPVLRLNNGSVKGLAFANRIGIIPSAKSHFSHLREHLKWNKRFGKYVFKPWEKNIAAVGSSCSVKTLIFPKFVLGEGFRVKSLSSREINHELMTDMYAPKNLSDPENIFHKRIFKTLSKQAKGFSIVYGEQCVKSVAQWILNQGRRNEPK
jgi:glycosyltransferase involved in cell wall biosynthesis